jgi:hypothetical protein
MSLQNYGLNSSIEKSLIEHGLSLSHLGRIIAEHKERYVVMTEAGGS